MNWQKNRLGDISEMCLGKMLDKNKNKGELQPYLANVNVRWGSFNFNSLSQMRFEEKESERYGLKYGDLIICEGGEPGRCALWKNEVPEMKIQKALHRVRIKKTHSTEFVYYRFLLAKDTGELSKHFIGSTIKHLTGIGLKEVEFEYPLLIDQQKIAKVLSTLDAKIELNNKINAELEAMAKLLYDYWFVQFDFPMTAEQATALGNPALKGKPYKSSGGPMTYKNVLKREIPEVWETSNIGSLLKTHLGGTPARKNTTYWNPSTIPWLSSGNKGDLFVCSSDEAISQAGLGNSAATLLPSGSVIISIVRHIRTSIIGLDATTNQSVVGILESDKFKHSFIYPFLTAEIPRLMSLRTGALQPHINKKTIDETPLAVPCCHILTEYQEKADPLFELMLTNQKQNQELTTLRDWLLPMLMNGQVTVK